MEIEELIGLIAPKIPITAGFTGFLSGNLQWQVCKKGECLVKAGSLVDRTWVIVKGLAKSQHYDGSGRQIITRFWKETEVLMLKDREVSGQVFYATQDIILLEETKLASISNQLLSYAFMHFPEANHLARKVYFSEIRSRDLRGRLLIQDAASAYAEFRNHFPASRIALQDIAYYLNIRPYTLSRIRKFGRDHGE